MLLTHLSLALTTLAAVALGLPEVDFFSELNFKGRKAHIELKPSDINECTEVHRLINGPVKSVQLAEDVRCISFSGPQCQGTPYAINHDEQYLPPNLWFLSARCFFLPN
ncbi:hypothetical protein O988_04702 [Pseudogymnoascus sp. VKM F-3808]|nr:hypothetical protein O988_04702 [Pseudogymnoascus sp. VKM F-3808]